jgi:toxin ParE1/3/4
MINILFLPAAESELIDAAVYYESQANNLGKDFLHKVEISLKSLSANPLQYPAIDHGTHRCLLHRFPYAILYKIDKSIIVVVAIMHLHRHPDYWIERI